MYEVHPSSSESKIINESAEHSSNCVVLCISAGMHTSVREVHIPSEPDSSYFLRVDWSGRGLGSGFQLLLTDGQDAWRGDGKNVPRLDLAACRVTFNTSDLTDLCSPDTFT